MDLASGLVHLFSFACVLLQILALGNQYGKTYVWDLEVDDPTLAR